MNLPVPEVNKHHFEIWQCCLDCNRPLRAHEHLYNHWNKFHSPNRHKDTARAKTNHTQQIDKPVHRFAVWVGGVPKEVGLMTYLWAQSQGMLTAVFVRKQQLRSTP